MKKDVLTITPGEPVAAAASLMIKNDIGMLIVVEDAINKIPVGVISDRDIISRLVLKDKDPAKTTIEEIMTPKIFSIAPNENLSKALQTMKKNNIKRLIVLDPVNQELAGIISNSDIIKQLIAMQRKLVDLTIGF